MKSLFVMTALVIFFLSATAQELPTKPNLLTFHTGPLTEQVSNIVTNNDSLDIVLLDTKGEAVAKIPAWDSRDITPKAYLANQYLIQVFDSSSNKYKVSKLYPPKMEAYIPAGVFYFSEMVTGYYTDSVKYSDSEYYYSDSSFVELPKSEWHIDSSWMFRKIAVINYSYARPADLKFYFVLQNNHYSNDQIRDSYSLLGLLYQENDSLFIYFRDDYAHGQKKNGEFIQSFIRDHQNALEDAIKFLPHPELDYDLLEVNIGYYDGLEYEEDGMMVARIIPRTLIVRLYRN